MGLGLGPNSFPHFEEDDREEEDDAVTAGHEHLEMEIPASKSIA